MFIFDNSIVYHKGEYVNSSQANLSIGNTSFLYGLGVFTGMRVFKNPITEKLYIFRPKDHFSRLKFSCKILRYEGFNRDYSIAQFTEIIKQLVIRNNITEDVYIRVTNYTDETKIGPKLVGYKDSLSIYLYPLGDYIPLTGIKCKISTWVRARDSAIPARAKINGLYVNTAFAKAEALLDGYDEAIFLNDRGHVVEGSAENIFIVRNGQLITPPPSDEVLEGITRASVMELAKERGINCIERSISRTELYAADEVFLTGTGAKVAPVIEIDKYVIGTGTVGPISKFIQDSYASAARGDLPEYAHWLEEVVMPNK